MFSHIALLGAGRGLPSSSHLQAAQAPFKPLFPSAQAGAQGHLRAMLFPSLATLHWSPSTHRSSEYPLAKNTTAEYLFY